jgi:hypothetical protein
MNADMLRLHGGGSMALSHFRPGLITFTMLVLIAAAVRVATVQVPDRQALLDLNRQLLESVFVRGETAMLAAAALPNLVVVPPGGVVENREQVLNGVPRVAGAEAVEVDDVVVVDHGTTAVVVARVRTRREKPIAGAPPGETGRSRMMNVFVHEQGKWRLLARSITPCIERAVAAGRC